jgi:membrane protease YdiL (CAAX protease family)
VSAAAPADATSADPALPPPVQDTRWSELLLYLLSGFGLFAVAGALVARLAGPATTILASLAVYGLNCLCFAGAAYFLGVRRQGLSWREFGLRPFPLRWLGAGLLASAAVLPLRACAALAAQVALGGGLDQLDARMQLIMPPGDVRLNLALTLLGAGLLAPLAEEFYFRGLLHRWFWAHFSTQPWLRVLLSSGVFALGHVDSAGAVASTFFLGLLCAVVYERTRSLWLAVAIHAANNSLAVLLVYAALALQPNLPGP